MTKEQSDKDEQVKMLPCPFCGGSKALRISSSNEDLDNDDEHQHPEFWGVVCDASTDRKLNGCGASAGYRASHAEAVQDWNHRAVPECGTLPPVAWMRSGPSGMEFAPYRGTLLDAAGWTRLYTAPVSTIGPGDGMAAGRFHCACVFSRPTDFSEAVLVSECAYHSARSATQERT